MSAAAAPRVSTRHRWLVATKASRKAMLIPCPRWVTSGAPRPRGAADPGPSRSWAADDDLEQYRVLERFGVRPQVRGEVEGGAVQQLLDERVWPGGPQVLVLPLLDGHAYPEPAVGRGYPTREAARPQFQPYGGVVGPEVGEGD